MSATGSMTGHHDQTLVHEAAAQWHERLQHDKVPAQVRSAFESWLETHEANRKAYEAVSAAWSRTRESASESLMMALRHETALRLTRKSTRWSSTALRVAAAAIVLTAGLMLAMAAGFPGTRELTAQLRSFTGMAGEHYSTALGERLAVTLHDGSQVTLNTDSRVETVFTDRERRIRLKQGQALFEVATDPARPFIVEVEGRQITALGTAFDVRVEGSRVRLTMLEGLVKVATETGETLIPGGRQWLLDSDAAAHPVRPVSEAELQRFTSWRHGQVIFEDTPLAEAIGELNRYSTTQVQLADPSLGALRLSGAFATGRTDVFVEALTRYFAVEVARADSTRIVLARRPEQ
jgi:transmembrane sensor